MTTEPSGPATAATRAAPATPTPTPSATPARYGGRILGLDLARAIAIFGMFYAHLVRKDSTSGTLVSFLQAIPDGRSAILFSLLAGVSLAILTGRNVPYVGNRMRHAQVRIAGRGLALIALGAFLTWLGTAVIVILGYYGFWFLLSIPFLRWSTKKLLAAAGVTGIVGPFLAMALKMLMVSQESDIFFTWAPDPNYALNGALFEGASYPGLQYMAFVFLGLALGRMNLTSTSLQQLMVLVGSGFALLGYSASWLLTNLTAESDWPASYSPPLGGFGPVPTDDGYTWPTWDYFVTADPHTGTAFEAIASGGVAVAVLGFCLLIGGLGKHVLMPLVAVGSMSLTAYAGHIVAMALWPALFTSTGHGSFLLVSAVTLVLCTVWKFIATRGPLEWLLWKFSLWFAKLPGDDADRAPEPVPVESGSAEPTRAEPAPQPSLPPAPQPKFDQ